MLPRCDGAHADAAVISVAERREAEVMMVYCMYIHCLWSVYFLSCPSSSSLDRQSGLSKPGIMTKSWYFSLIVWMWLHPQPTSRLGLVRHTPHRNSRVLMNPTASLCVHPSIRPRETDRQKHERAYAPPRRTCGPRRQMSGFSPGRLARAFLVLHAR
jgi:hypothetical protein